MPDLRALLADGHVHVTDGAMGTMLYSKGLFLNVCYDELNLRQPDVIRDIHREYVRAGAELIETNTFGANPVKLAHHGLAAETEAINEAAARLAREAAGDRAAVVGALGPLGIRIEPFGETSVEEARSAFARQAAGLLAGGVDGFLCETFSDVEELRAAVEAIKSVSDLPIIAQMTVGEDGRTHYGTAPSAFGPAIAAMDVDVIGVNCSVGPHGVLEAIEHLARVVNLPLSAMPNAGLPRDVGGRKMYMASPEYMASYAKRMVEAGARFVGGCCGTTPEHIKAMVGFVQSAAPRHAQRHDRPGGRAGRRAGAARRALTARRQAGRGRVHHHRGDRAAQGSGPRADVRPGPGSSRPPAWTPSTCRTVRARRAGWARCCRGC